MKKLITSLLFLITTMNIFSQRICSSSFDPASVQVTDNARYQRYLQTEQFILDYKNSLPPTNGKLINPNSVITIPVVVHVLHGGEAIGVGRNISVAQLQSQIDVLNEDFRRLNANRFNTPAGFAGVASDPLFQFQLACIDPNGNATNGILRRQTAVVSFTDNDNIKYTAQGGEDAWNTSRYLNLWVSTLQANLLGYAQFPFDFSTKPNTDGVVIRTTSFGRVGNVTAPFHQGRTATHEVGHWLNLFHIWGDDGGTCTGSDQCGDTPNQGDENYGCPGFPQVSCANGANGDMFMNYMDYTDDPCMNLFSTDQRIRMRAIFSSGGVRESIINTSFALISLTTPICNTGTINLTNISCLTGVTWTITGLATILGNNNSALITRNGNSNGVATVTATVAGYTDTKQIIIGKGANAITFNQCIINCDAGPYLYANIAPVPGATNCNWYYKDMSNASNPFVFLEDAMFGTDWPLRRGNRNYTIRAEVITPCGTLIGDRVVFAPSCTGLLVAASPNPTTGDINLTFSEQTDTSSTAKLGGQNLSPARSIQSTGKTIVSLFEFNTSLLVRQWTQTDITSKTLNYKAAGLRKGLYILQVDRDNKTATTKIIVE